MKAITFEIDFNELIEAIEAKYKDKAKSILEGETDIIQTYISFYDKDGGQLPVEFCQVKIKRI